MAAEQSLAAQFLGAHPLWKKDRPQFFWMRPKGEPVFFEESETRDGKRRRFFKDGSVLITHPDGKEEVTSVE